MIAFLSGTLLQRGNGYIILRVGDIGYKVQIPVTFQVSSQEKIDMYIHEVIRDDGHELFGFQKFEALELFWKLMTVSGVGPKSAQKIIASAPVEQVRSHIATGNLAFLGSIPGIGKKTAQKILLELKGILAMDADTTHGVSDQETEDALLSLGYEEKEIQAVLKHLTAKTTEDRLKEALKYLSK